MKELVGKIISHTIEPCRRELSAFQNQAGTWEKHRVGIESLLADAPEDEEISEKKRGVGGVFLKAFASRLVQGMGEDLSAKGLAELRTRAQARLDECHLACDLFAGSTGDAGRPWADGGFRFSEAPTDDRDTRIGSLVVPCPDLQKALPNLAWEISLPAMLPLSRGKAVCILAPPKERERAVEAVQSTALRLLLASPAGKVALTILDPEGLCIGGLPWARFPGVLASGASRVEVILKEVLSGIQRMHKERGGFEGDGAPLSHVIVVLDGDTLQSRAAQSLRPIIRNGGNSGIVVLVQATDRDNRFEMQRFLELVTGCSMITWDEAVGSGFVWEEDGLGGCLLQLDAMPPGKVLGEILGPLIMGRAAEATKAESQRMEKKAAVSSLGSLLETAGLGNEEAWWRDDSRAGFEGVLGWAKEEGGFGDPVVCTFGKESSHALLAGVTGSGKNNLLNVLITTMALRYSPAELEFFLIDLKEGIEFQRFARMGFPHARVVSVSNDPDFALSVLRGLEAEMEERGKLFASAGVNGIETYRNKTNAPLPRILLVIDESKTLYAGPEEAYVTRFIDKMAAKGRAFGLHLLLCNQTFSSPPLRSSIMMNIGLRMVTKGKGETSADSVLDMNNRVLGTLDRHQAVFNDGRGAKEYNKLCQVPQWMDNDDDFLSRLAGMAKRTLPELREPLVFDGGSSCLSTCAAFSESGTVAREGIGRMWLGKPMSLKDSVCIEIRPEAGRNLLIVDRDEEEATGVLVAAWVGLLASLPIDTRFVLLDLSTRGKPWSGILQDITHLIGDRVSSTNEGDILEQLKGMVSLVEERQKSRLANQSPIILLLHGLHRWTEFRKEAGGYSSSSTSLDNLLGAVLRNGPSVAVYTVAWADTAISVRKMLSSSTGNKNMLQEFCIVAAGKLASVNEAEFLLRSSKYASKLQEIEKGRMVLSDIYADDGATVIRPYVLPDIEWLADAICRFKSHHVQSL